MKIKLLDRKTTKWIPLPLIQKLKTELIGMAGNQLLVDKLIISRAEDQYCPRPEAGRQLFSDGTLQRNNLMVNNLLIDSINKGSEILPVYQMM